MNGTDAPHPEPRSDLSLTNGGRRAAASGRPRREGLVLAGWLVLHGQNRLAKGDQHIPLEPKAMDVLVALAAAEGATRSRDELMDEVWPNVIVTDDSLHRAISRLRRALAPYPELQDLVRTVPKRGYRLDWKAARAGDPPAEAIRDVPARDLAEEGSGGRGRGYRWGHLFRVGVPAAAVILVFVAAMGGFRAADRDYSSLRTAPFTGLPGQERAASFAPDGHRAVFAWSGESGADWDLYVKGVDEWTPRRLTDIPGPEFNPAWSPDGTTIAFVRLTPGGGCRVTLITEQGGEERPLRECAAGGDVDLSWSPDGKVLYFTDRVGATGPIAVHRLELASGNERQISYPPPDHWGDSLVRVSPDGSRLAVARTRALGVTDLYTVSPDGGNERQLTNDRLKIHGVAWSADGEAIYFSSNRGGSFGLWRIGEDGGTLQPVTVGGINADSVTASRDGNRLIFETEDSSSRLWALALDGDAQGGPRVLSRASGWHWHPAVSPDGSSLAFVSDRSGSPEVWVSTIDDAAPRKLTDFGGPYTNSPTWSPDGQRILFTTPVDGNFEIYTVDVGSGDLEKLTDHPATDRNPTWSRDGRSVYFGSNRSGRWEVWRLGLDGGALEQVTRRGGFRALERDDRTVLFVKRDDPGLFALDTAAGATETRLSGELLPLDWSNWDVVGDSVYLVTRGGEDGPRLARLDLATGTTEYLQALARFPHESGIAVAPDHSAVFFARTDKVEVDLVLLEGFEAG
jgi:Tol biopolymer transport system component/DNA-binding winged helix-turn-helix (wHTH) protein